MRAFAALSFLVAAVAAVPLPLQVAHDLAKRNCRVMPSSVDPKMRDIIYTTVHGLANTDDVKQSGGVDRVLLITMVTAYTESMVNDLDCGDKDSLGLFQQRPSQNWGTPSQIQDPNYSINKFLEALYPLAKSHPNTPPGTMAQMVQNAEAGDQYTKNVGTAEQLIRDAAASVGDSGDDNNDKPAPKPKPTSTEAPAPKPTSGNDNGNGATNVGSKPGSGNDNTDDNDNNNDDGDDSDCDDDEGSGDDDSDNSGSENTSTGVPSTSTPSQFTCTKTYQPKAGDNCYFLTGKFGISLDDVYAWNTNIDSECHNLQIGADYCVAIAQ